MKILILTEGSKIYGLGHVSRMLALYEAFEEFGGEIEMLVKGDDSVQSLLRSKNYKLFDWQKNIAEAKIDADIIIIDSYTADIDIYKYLSKEGDVCIYFDDFKRLNYPRGIVVNGTIYAEKLNYPKKEGVKYLLGSKYIPLRKEFWNLPEKIFNEHIRHVLIMFGGDDIKNVTPKVLKFLQQEYPKFTYNVVIGKAFKEKNIEEIKEISKGRNNINLLFYPDAREIIVNMLKCDIGVIAAGLMTLYESMCVGLPVVTITTMENQVDVLNRVIETGFIEHCGWYNDPYLFDKLKDKIEYLKNKDIRVEKARIGRKFIDGKGALRIAKYAIEELKKKNEYSIS